MAPFIGESWRHSTSHKQRSRAGPRKKKVGIEGVVQFAKLPWCLQ
jgi:hypothetical protein